MDNLNSVLDVVSKETFIKAIQEFEARLEEITDLRYRAGVAENDEEYYESYDIRDDGYICVNTTGSCCGESVRGYYYTTWFEVLDKEGDEERYYAKIRQKKEAAELAKKKQQEEYEAKLYATYLALKEKFEK